MYGVRSVWAGVASVVDGLVWPTLGVAVLALLAGCGSTALTRAPVEDRSAQTTAAARQVATLDPRTPSVKQPPGFDNAGKAGYYTVKPGDTLIRIGLESGQSHKDLARWNSLDNPNKIEVGQVLRIAPPTAAEGVSTKPVVGAGSTTTSLPPASPVVAPVVGKVASATASVLAPATGSTTPAPSAAPPPAAAASAVPASTGASAEEDMGWLWPSGGPVIAGFDEAKNKGIDIGGAAGDSVQAAAEGKVVYAGAGLRGYGNLVILKHNNTFLTAYAHNQTLLVKEDQTVKKGQKIAEMGNSDADRVKLHFEVRKLGKPVDPIKYLPAR